MKFPLPAISFAYLLHNTLLKLSNESNLLFFTYSVSGIKRTPSCQKHLFVQQTFTMIYVFILSLLSLTLFVFKLVLTSIAKSCKIVIILIINYKSTKALYEKQKMMIMFLSYTHNVPFFFRTHCILQNLRLFHDILDFR